MSADDAVDLFALGVLAGFYLLAIAAQLYFARCTARECDACVRALDAAQVRK